MNNKEIFSPLGQVLETLKQCINTARNALEARLTHRRISLNVFLKKERLILVLVHATSQAYVSLRELWPRL